jgi:ribosomal protein S18 acetylase RimI-like enzyme
VTIAIHMLQAGDERVLDNVATDVFDDPIQKRAAKEFLADPRHHLAVAMDGEVVVGFVSAVSYVHPDKPIPEMWINEVGVAPTHHRRGIAKGLLNGILDEARALGCAEAWVLTDRDNDAAMHAYASVGGEAADQVMVTFELSGGTA